ncbi:hypothetical protein IFM89_036437 [Coptis chinensis]|uniref:Uncharacterized protein n=1 Tax=Coptis chinensis TaxID=261450 RepID=A0A835IGN7_9MAGN|nr:hypothetical protein IFM89_036437 [Coptis chinensis]
MALLSTAPQSISLLFSSKRGRDKASWFIRACSSGADVPDFLSADCGGPNQIKRRKKRGCFNLRKTLAWNNAFFTEEGVLNPQELSRIVGSHSNEFLLGISEEETKSVLEDSAETPTFDASTCKVIDPFPQNAQYSGGKFSNALIQPSKPSVLRMPSPSIRYFSQPESSTPLTIKSPRNTETCNLHEVNIPSMKKLCGSNHTGYMKFVHELSGTVTVNEGDIKARSPAWKTHFWK